MCQTVVRIFEVYRRAVSAFLGMVHRVQAELIAFLKADWKSTVLAFLVCTAEA